MKKSRKPIRPGFVVCENRRQKADKILAVLSRFTSVSGESRLLDVGCGSGEIAYWLSQSVRVDALDVEDFRTQEWAGVVFRTYEGSQFPYPDDTFDIVVTNHVIEHTGDPATHMREVTRVLKPGGYIYFATPNRLYPREVHYRLYLLHYLPLRWFIKLMKMTGKYREDLHLLFHFEMERLFRGCGLEATEMTTEILKHPEAFHSEVRILEKCPGFFVHLLRHVAQTNIFVLKKP